MWQCISHCRGDSTYPAPQIATVVHGVIHQGFRCDGMHRRHQTASHLKTFCCRVSSPSRAEAKTQMTVITQIVSMWNLTQGSVMWGSSCQSGANRDRDASHLALSHEDCRCRLLYYEDVVALNTILHDAILGAHAVGKNFTWLPTPATTMVFAAKLALGFCEQAALKDHPSMFQLPLATLQPLTTVKQNTFQLLALPSNFAVQPV